MSNVLSALVVRDGAVEADAFRRVCVRADEQSYDIRPAREHVTMAELRRIVARPPAGWQGS